MELGQFTPRQRAHPKRRINPAFRDVVRLVMRDRMLGKDICLVVGFPQQANLSEVLHRPFATSPLVMDRLQRLANLVGFEGALLAEEHAQ